MLWRRCPGLMPRGLRGWIAKRFATRLFVTMRDWRGFTTVQRATRRQTRKRRWRRSSSQPERDGVCAWTRADLCRWLEERKTSSMGFYVGFSRQKARPSREGTPKRRSASKKGASRHPAAAPDKRLQCGFRMKPRRQQGPGVSTGRACPRDASNRLPVGLHLIRRAPGHRRRRHPGDARQRQGHGPVSRTLRDTLDQDAHAVMMCDGAGWHDERALTVPDNVTLALLPPYSPELNPVERVNANASYRRPRRHRGHHRRLLPSMDRPHRRTGSYANPLRLSMDHEGDFIGSRYKKGPLGGCGLVPVVHGRAPRATRRALNRLTRRRAREGPVGPRGQAWAGWSVQLAVGV